jgi:hypothetical protein
MFANRRLTDKKAPGGHKFPEAHETTVNGKKSISNIQPFCHIYNR